MILERKSPLKTKISQNGFKGTKPTENKGESSKNTNKNAVLSTEKGGIENEK